MAIDTLEVKKDETAADLPVLLYEITSKETGEILRVSKQPITFQSNLYSARVLRETISPNSIFSATGVDQPSEITVTLGDVDDTYKTWDNTNFFQYATVSVFLVFWNATDGVTSSDSLTYLIGISDAPSRVTPNEFEFKIINKLFMQQIPIPAMRISRLSPSILPGEGIQDSDLDAAYADAFTDRNNSAWPVPYGPLRGRGGFSGSTPKGNFRDADSTNGKATSLGIFSAPYVVVSSTDTSVDLSAVTMPTDAHKEHIVAIMAGTGIGQMRRIASNDSNTLTIKSAWDTNPDGTSRAVILWGWIGKTKTDFNTAGLFEKDEEASVTRYFRGLTFTPEPFRHRLVNGKRIITPIEENMAKYGEPIARIYGTGWVPLKMLFNLRENAVFFHALLGEGEINSVSRMVVEGTSIVEAVGLEDKGGGKFDFFSPALNFGAFFVPPSGRGDKTDSDFESARFDGHDPYNLLAVIYGVVPPEFVGGDGDGDPVGIFSGAAFVSQGSSIETLDDEGVSAGFAFSNNTVWVYYDLLKISGFSPDELYGKSFHSASQYALELINTHRVESTTILQPRFEFNDILGSARPAADALLGCRRNARIINYFNSDGKLAVRIENKLPDTTLNGAIGSTGQQFVDVNDMAGFHVDDTVIIDEGGGNEETVTILALNIFGSTTKQFEANFVNTHSDAETVKGKVKFSFDDTNILYRLNQGPAIERSSPSIRDTPNSFVGDFFNKFRDYSQDGAELLDADSANKLGAKVVQQLPADGLAHADAFSRSSKLHISQAIRARDNIFGGIMVKVVSTVKTVLLQLGDIVDVTYSPEGWTNQQFRVVGINPVGTSNAFENLEFTLSAIDNDWYDAINGNIVRNSRNLTAPDDQTGTTGTGGGGGGIFTGCPIEGTAIDVLGDEPAEIFLNDSEEWIEIEISDERVLIATPLHQVFSEKRGKIAIKDLKFMENIITKQGLRAVIVITPKTIKAKSIKVQMAKNHLYYAHGILSHNSKPSDFDLT